MKYSIITVSLNPGESLKKTLDSIKAQTYPEYEVIIKDGGSTDNSLAAVPKDMRYRIIYGTDKGIYDAMNMAVKGAVGDVVIFLNAGDLFYDEHVLEKMTEKIEKAKLKPPFIANGTIEQLATFAIIPTPRLNLFNPSSVDNFPSGNITTASPPLSLVTALSIAVKPSPNYKGSTLNHFNTCFIIGILKATGPVTNHSLRFVAICIIRASIFPV